MQKVKNPKDKPSKFKNLKVETNFNTDRTDQEWRNVMEANTNSNSLPKVQTPTTGQESKKSFERDGDWVCFKCKNLNFSFRNTCNKCNLTHEASNNMSIIYKNDGGYKLAASPFFP